MHIYVLVPVSSRLHGLSGSVLVLTQKLRVCARNSGYDSVLMSYNIIEIFESIIEENKK